MAAPAGRILRRAHFAYIGVSDALLSLVVWGHVARADVEELFAVLTCGEARAKRRDALVQMQAMTGIDEESVRAMTQFMLRTAARSRSMTRREAVVRPGGTVGMLVAGFYGVVPAEYPMAIFADRGDALAWLRLPKRSAVSLEALSDSIIAAGLENPDLLYRLREHLAHHPKQHDIVRVAAELESSARTLQRRLAEAGTSFEKELGRARISAAKSLLLRSSMAIKEVAHEVGLPSASRLSQLFATHEGRSPSAWRKHAESERDAHPT